MAVANARPDLSHGYKYNTPQDNYQGATPDHSASGISVNINEHDHHQVAASGPAASYSASGSVASLGFGSSGSAGSASFGASGSATQGLSVGISSGASHGSQQSYSASGPAISGVISAGNNGASSSSSGNFQSQQDYSSSSGSTVGVAAFPAQQQHQQVVVAGFNGGNNAQQYSSSSSIKSSGNTFGVSQQGSNFISQQQSNNFQQGGKSAAAAYSDIQQLEPIITKNFYFEAAPEEPEETQGPRFVPIGRPQKNYKIIFIKTPSYGLNSQVIPIVPPNEEKTIVYVLSKKPEFNQDIELPSIPVTEATKPEVFFIKYKNDQEASDAQNQIQGNNIFLSVNKFL